MNADALRAITDDSGGRTEIIVSPKDLAPATAGIADELSRQYFHRLHVVGSRRTGAGTRSRSGSRSQAT